MTGRAGPVEAVIFDWGGTLSVWADVDMADMWRLAAEHLAAGTAVGADDYVAALVEAEDAFWERCSAGSQSARLADLLAEASTAVGADVAAAVLEEAAVRHLDSWTPHVAHDPDAVPVLRALRERGLRTGLLSNTHWPEHWHEHFLERDGLLGLLDVRVYSSNEPHMKPHPAIFHTTLERLGVAPERAVFVGDRQLDDVSGAQGVGMRAVWKATPFAHTHPGVVPDHTVTALPELLSLV